ncbi:hypothetical protein HAX54_001426, partial [Datura stramonium]|nr:hypothetical protein [Datura stramonium]
MEGVKLDDGPSLVVSRINPFSCMAVEALKDCQVSDGLSHGPLPKTKFLDPLFKAGGVDDGPS